MYIHIIIFIIFNALVNLQVYGVLAVESLPVDGDDILQYNVKSQWNRFLDDFTGVIRQFDYDAFLTLEDILLDKPYYTGDPDDGGPRDKEKNYNKKIIIKK